MLCYRSKQFDVPHRSRPHTAVTSGDPPDADVRLRRTSCWEQHLERPMKILVIAAATIAMVTTAFAETDTFDKASTGSLPAALTCGVTRSEERRVGKE